MIRYFFFVLLGFFGPALLMLLMRLIWMRLRGQLQKPKPEIIDITPVHSHKPSRLFILSWLFISVLCTGLLIWQLDDAPAPAHTYIPAHINAEGEFVPAQTIQEKAVNGSITQEKPTENKADK